MSFEITKNSETNFYNHGKICIFLKIRHLYSEGILSRAVPKGAAFSFAQNLLKVGDYL